jgi:hypothetical protein
MQMSALWELSQDVTDLGLQALLKVVRLVKDHEAE